MSKKAKVQFFTCLILAQILAGESEDARATLLRARSLEDESWVADRQWLDFAESALHRQPGEVPLAWFREHHFVRVASFLERIAAAL